MKKLVIGAVLALAASSASALELGVQGSRNYDTDRNALGVTVSHKISFLDVTAGFDRSTKNGLDQDRWTVVGGLPLTKIGPLSVSVKGGGAYLVNDKGADGKAAVAGVGVKFPMTKKVSFTADFMRQWGETAVKAHDGNSAVVGLSYKF